MTSNNDPGPPACSLVCRGRRVEFPRRPLVMGILNINDDSFCRDGTLNQDRAMRHALELCADGADIVDVGAESARTNREPIPVAEEIDRLLPFVHAFASRLQDRGDSLRDDVRLDPPLLSINTWRPAVVEAVLATGKVDLVNDIGGLPDDTNAALCAKAGASLLIMHTLGTPKSPRLDESYDDIWASLLDFFRRKIGLAVEAGLSRDALVLDPGIDFAKQRRDNLTIYRELERLVELGHPVLMPVSRKTVIGEVLGIEDPACRDAGTMACVAAGVRRGAHIFRVHNVRAAAQSIEVMHQILG